MFSPPVSKCFLRALEAKGRMPKHVKNTKDGFIYESNQIEEWLSKGVEKNKCGRKEGEQQSRMSKQDFDHWNIRKNKENIEYSEEMTMLIMFFQPALRNRHEGNALGQR